MAEEKPKVLYVDDLPLNLKLFEATFRQDYEITITQYPGEVMGILEEKEIQVVISDQRMPEMNGTELLEMIAKKYPNIRRFLLTAFTDTETVIEAVNKGRIHGYLRKPLQTDEIRRSLTSSMEVFHLRNRNRLMMEELEKANKALHNLDDLKSDIINSIGKEIASPLNRIMSTLHLLKSRIEGDELSEVVKVLDSSVFKLEQFSQLARQISELKSPGFILKKDKVLLKQVLQFSSIETSEELEEQNIILRKEVSDEGLEVDGDAGLLVSCLVALIRFAREHTEHAGEIAVRAERRNGETVCRICDQGATYSAEDFSILSAHFSDTDTTMNLDMGIGLGLAQMIMEAHGGSIVFKSETENHGCFEMVFAEDKAQ